MPDSDVFLCSILLFRNEKNKKPIQILLFFIFNCHNMYAIEYFSKYLSNLCKYLTRRNK